MSARSEAVGTQINAPSTTGRKSALTRSRVLAAWMFLTPMLIVLALVAGWPLVRTIWFGFTDANLSDLAAGQFIGFENYLAYYEGEWYGVLADGEWWNSVWNTVYFAVISVSIETILGLAIALRRSPVASHTLGPFALDPSRLGAFS